MANQEHYEILKQGIDVWNKWRKDHPDIGPDLSEADLSKVDLKGANLSEADLNKADLRNASLDGANLSGANLSGANLSGADLSGADLSGATLSRTNFSSADLSSANFEEAWLGEANLSGANLKGIRLGDANLGGANLSGVNLSRIDLSRINLYGANLSGANLSGANLSGATLSQANLNSTDLSSANLEGASLGDAKFNKVNLSGAYLSGANLSGANLSGANLSKINLSWANLRSTNLSETNLSKANLSWVDLSGAKLDEANLSGADLSWANLSWANLSRANLSSVNFKVPDSRTRLIGSIATRRVEDFSENRPKLKEMTTSYKTIISGVCLSHADLSHANLIEANLSYANLYQANLSAAKLSRIHAFKTIFSKATLIEAILDDADLISADLTFADLSEVNLRGANLYEANLSYAQLHKANLEETTLYRANLESAKLIETVLIEANLNKANLKEADLSGANLDRASLVETNLSGAILTGCHVYGTAVWDVYLSETIQDNLIITPPNQPTITVDNLKVAQFIYLLLNNQKIREIIDPITSKVVLLIGCFTLERKGILNILRDELRKQNYLPVVFNFEEVKSSDFITTVRTLANMARFMLLDLTELGSALDEIVKIVPHCTVPLQPLLSGEYQHRYNQLLDLRRQCHWVLAPYHFQDHSSLLASFQEKIIRPAEVKGKELQQREPIPIFIGYDSQDENVLIELKKHLSILERSGQIKLWDDREVQPGEEKEKEIERQLSHARIILLLISPDFIASDIFHVMQERAMDRHIGGEVRVIPLLLRPCAWQSTRLKELRPLPKDGQPLSKHNKDDVDDVFFKVSEDIGDVIKSLG